jgi:hypothetical protein
MGDSPRVNDAAADQIAGSLFSLIVRGTFLAPMSARAE